MSGHRLAVVVLSAAVLLPGTVLHAAPAAASETTIVAAPKLTAHQRHVRHRHHVHVLHLLRLRNHPPAPRSSRSLSRTWGKPIGIRARIIAAAERYKGQPYSYGNLDCSGLTQRAYHAVGRHLPRRAADQQRAARHVRSPLPGDLVFYGRPAYHVGIYLGRGKMIVARHTGTVVGEQMIWGSPMYGTVLT